MNASIVAPSVIFDGVVLVYFDGGYVDGASICGILMFGCEMIGRFSMVLPYVLDTIIIKSLGKLFSISN